MINILEVIGKPNPIHFSRFTKPTGSCSCSSYAYNYNDPDHYYRKRIGNRECVGFGINGEPEYFDRPDFPFPSIRYSPPSSEFLALREKEKGDWRLLSIQDKKKLYRFNYCQTFPEFLHPKGEWMYTLGMSFLVVSGGLWLYILVKLFVYSQQPEIDTFKEVNQKGILRKWLLMHNGPVTGIASKWDYENKRWKKRPWYIPWEDPFSSDCEWRYVKKRK